MTKQDPRAGSAGGACLVPGLSLKGCAQAGREG